MYPCLIPIVGVSVSELFNHFFNDFLSNRYIWKHDGILKREIRLWINYVATFFTISGLTIVSQVVKKHLPLLGHRHGMGNVRCWSYARVRGHHNLCFGLIPNKSWKSSLIPQPCTRLQRLHRRVLSATVGWEDRYGISFGVQACVLPVALAKSISTDSSEHESKGWHSRSVSNPLFLQTGFVSCIIILFLWFPMIRTNHQPLDEFDGFH